MKRRSLIAFAVLSVASIAFSDSLAWSQPGNRPGRATTKPAGAVSKAGKRTTSTTRPTTRPATKPSKSSKSPKSLTADEMLSRMLKPPAAGASSAARPLPPVPDPPAQDKTSGEGAVAPAAPSVTVLREGTFLVDRLGRLSRGEDGSEFVFESDGSALQDPPMRLLPNLKMMQMEEMVSGADRDRRFRVTGMVTEYRGRNYLLLEKVLIVPDATEQF